MSFLCESHSSFKLKTQNIKITGVFYWEGERSSAVFPLVLSHTESAVLRTLLKNKTVIMLKIWRAV